MALDKTVAVPEFGGWEKDPKSAENLTDIFKKVREQKKSGSGTVSSPRRHSSYPTRSQPSNQPKRCCCPWW